MTIKPANWESLKNWQAFDRAKIKQVMAEFTAAFSIAGYLVHFDLWEPPQGSAGFVSMGVQKKGMQPNKNLYSTVYAYGWFAKRAVTWPQGFTSYYAAEACKLVERFYGPKCEIVSKRLDDDAVLREFGWTGEIDPFEDAGPPLAATHRNYSTEAKERAARANPAKTIDPFEEELPASTVQPKLMSCGSCGGTGRSSSSRGQCWDCEGRGKVQFVQPEEVDPLS